MSDPRVMLVADLHGLAGAVTELESLLADLATASRSEPGCESFRFFAAEELGDFFVISTWADEEALRTHYRSAHYARYVEAVGPFLARPSDGAVHRISETTHARDPNPPDPGMLG
jgi:quinol monooxygenase YgiN